MKLLEPKIILFIGVFFTSISSILIKYTVSHPFAVSFYRMLFAFLLMVPFFLTGLVRGHYSLPGLRDLVRILFSGLFLGAHFATWISSLRYTSVASSVVLVSTHPVLVLLLGALFLKEAVPPRGWYYVALVVAGTALLSAGDIGGGKTMLLGDLLALTGGVCVALYILIGRSVRTRVGLVPYTFLVYGISALFLFLIMLVSGEPLTGYPPRELSLFFALALFCTIGGHSLYNYVLRYLTAGLVSVSVLMEPVIATLLALILFQELSAPFSLAGAVLIVYGISRYAGSRR
jgi:drug/metabolite transporter (DMT)-like permease